MVAVVLAKILLPIDSTIIIQIVIELSIMFIAWDDCLIVVVSVDPICYWAIIVSVIIYVIDWVSDSYCI